MRTSPKDFTAGLDPSLLYGFTSLGSTPPAADIRGLRGLPEVRHAAAVSFHIPCSISCPPFVRQVAVVVNEEFVVLDGNDLDEQFLVG
jgi:hypothetical protein